MPHLFRSTTRPSASVMIRFIDEYRDRFLVEFICDQVKELPGWWVHLLTWIPAIHKPVDSVLIAFVTAY